MLASFGWLAGALAQIVARRHLDVLLVDDVNVHIRGDVETIVVHIAQSALHDVVNDNAEDNTTGVEDLYLTVGNTTKSPIVTSAFVDLDGVKVIVVRFLAQGNKHCCDTCFVRKPQPNIGVGKESVFVTGNGSVVERVAKRIAKQFKRHC